MLILGYSDNAYYQWYNLESIYSCSIYITLLLIPLAEAHQGLDCIRKEQTICSRVCVLFFFFTILNAIYGVVQTMND